MEREHLGHSLSHEVVGCDKFLQHHRANCCYGSSALIGCIGVAGGKKKRLFFLGIGAVGTTFLTEGHPFAL